MSGKIINIAERRQARKRETITVAECEREAVLRRAVGRLNRLDVEQIQIAEVVIAAIARGRRD